MGRDEISHPFGLLLLAVDQHGSEDGITLDKPLSQIAGNPLPLAFEKIHRHRGDGGVIAKVAPQVDRLAGKDRPTSFHIFIQMRQIFGLPYP